MSEFKEPTIVINGVTLSNAQAMTVRVAMATFNPKTISFKTTKKERFVIAQIVGRAMCLCAENGIKYDPVDCRMDLTACHANGCKLDLNKLLSFQEFDFSHDIFGIRRHLNRETGELEDCFWPRCAKKQ